MLDKVQVSIAPNHFCKISDLVESELRWISRELRAVLSGRRPPSKIQSDGGVE